MNNHIQTAISEQGIEAYLRPAAQEPAAFSHLRQRGRRQRAPSSAACCTTPSRSMKISSSTGVRQPEARHHRREAGPGPCWWTACRRSASRGITIDVAYRYFSTAKRKFIISDTPGHEQYTRNMATGASTCDLAIIPIDARKGVLDQTRRHSFIASLLGINSSWWQ